MPKQSAGVLVFRRSDSGTGVVTQVVLVHPGGPFWARKDAGAWSIPKGEYADGEQAIDAARREFVEELGVAVPPGELIDIGSVTQSGGKVVTAYAVEADLDVTATVSNTFEMEWPRGSGTMRSFPEVDRVEWFDIEVARDKLVPAQREFLDRLDELGGDEVGRVYGR